MMRVCEFGQVNHQNQMKKVWILTPSRLFRICTWTSTETTIARTVLMSVMKKVYSTSQDSSVLALHTKNPTRNS